MKIDKLKNKEIREKSKNLKDINKQLKKEFIGLDSIIDDVCNSIESWYLFPDAQFRPTIINLWGMTGTGKTSLVKRLFELLDFGTLIKFDIGDWAEDDSNQTLRYKISGQLRKVKKEKNIPVFVFDEFQLGRSISKQGDDIDRSGLRVIWELIDSGKFDIVEESWEVEQLMKLYTKLNYCIEDKDVKCKNGSITKNKKEYRMIFPIEKSIDDEEPEELIKDGFVPDDKLWAIRKAWDDKFMSDKHLSEHIKTLSDEKSILKFIDDSLSLLMKPIEHDFSNSIIFNIGNLDEVYTINDDMNPDIDPDSLYEFTENITITDIKESLSRRFRSEQIGRLGNTHVIYKTFRSKDYEELIDLELNKVKSSIKDRFEIDIKFKKNTKKLIYRESVFPTQGARPIFSTIKNLIESYIGKIITDCIKNNIDANEIIWDYINDKYIINIIDTKGKSNKLEFEINLKVDNLRKSDNDDNQSLVAIHESGHIITSIFALNICPKIAMSKTASSSDGFTQIDIPHYESKGFLINNITMTLGGLIAEKLIFGEENITSGSYSDLRKATYTVVKMIKNYGMSDKLMVQGHDDFNDVVVRGDIAVKDNKEIEDIIDKCSKDCEKILNDNMELLLRMGDYLTKNSKIEDKYIKELVSKYAKDEATYKEKDNYYNFKNIVNEKLSKMKSKMNGHSINEPVE